MKNTNGIIARLGALCAENGVGIDSIHQNPITDENNVKFVIVTENSQSLQVQCAVHDDRCAAAL